MNNSSKNRGFIAIIAIVAIALSIGAIFIASRGNDNPVTVEDTGNLAAVGTKLPVENYMPTIKFNGGYYSTLPIWTTSSTTIESNLDVGGTVTFNGAIQMNGLFTQSLLPGATTTDEDSSSATLVEADLTDVGYYIWTNGGAQNSDFTYTLPASTTLTSFVANVGERSEVCWFQTASSTSGGDLIFVAGTGIDLTVATGTGTPAPLAIHEDQMGCIKFTRHADGAGLAGDVTAELKFQGDAD